MKLSQPIFAFILVIMLVTYTKHFRTSLLDRLIGVLILLTGLLAVLFPDLTNRVARSLDIGRGADLCFYIFALGTLFSLGMLYSQMSRLTHLNTKIVRHLAIQSGEETGRKED